jgi:competence protein ComEA
MTPHLRLLLSVALTLSFIGGVIAIILGWEPPFPGTIGSNRPGPPVRPTPRTIRVFITGAVARPGVYEVTPTQRVEDLLRLAGGPTSEADMSRVNPVQLLRDGMEVVIPSVRPTPTPRPTVPLIININQANQRELESLPGIGPVTAEKIIAYRTANGPFARIEDLRTYNLVSASTFEKIKGRITVQTP